MQFPVASLIVPTQMHVVGIVMVFLNNFYYTILDLPVKKWLGVKPILLTIHLKSEDVERF